MLNTCIKAKKFNFQETFSAYSTCYTIKNRCLASPSDFSEERVSFTFWGDNFAVTEKTFATLPYQFFSLMISTELFPGCDQSLVYKASIITEARLQNVCSGLG